MGIKSKQTGGLRRKRDIIQIIHTTQVVSPLGGNTADAEVEVYNGFADVVRVNEYRTVQYGFETQTKVYDIFINRIANLPTKDIHVVYCGGVFKVHLVSDTDENLGQKLRIVVYG